MRLILQLMVVDDAGGVATVQQIPVEIPPAFHGPAVVTLKSASRRELVNELVTRDSEREADDMEDD